MDDTRSTHVRGLLVGVAMAALALAPAGVSGQPGDDGARASAKPTGGRDYKGRTSQHRYVLLHTASDAGGLWWDVGWKAKRCDRRGYFWADSTYVDSTTPVRNGRFSDRVSYRSGGKLDGKTVKTRVSGKFRGSFRSARKARGKLKVRVRVYRKGGLVLTCRTGSVSWTAKRK